jgi:hypothetical protein
LRYVVHDHVAGTDRGQLRVEPLIVGVFPREAQAEKLRVDTDQALAR